MIETTDVKLDRAYWNIVKGIGIFCVIMGHACMWSQHFIYLFHLQLFFFASGYFYSEKKYGEHPFLNVKNKLKSTWKVYVILYIIVILLHNVLMDLGLQPLAYSRYSAKDMVWKIFNAILGNGAELMLGPAWFLVTVVQASVVLGFLIWGTRWIEKKTRKTWLKLLVQAVVVVSLAAYAYPLVLGQVQWFADFQYALIVLPYLWIGYLVRNYIGDIRRFLHPVLGLLCVLIVYKVSTYEWVDITIGHLFPYMHFVAVFGIYMCLCFAQMIQKIPHMNRLTEFMGEHSMAIMIVHFPLLRLMDKFIAVFIYGDPTGELFNHIPVAFEQLWPIYMVVDVPLTLLVVWVWVKIQNIYKRKRISRDGSS